MLTLTVPHGLGDDLTTIRTGVSKAWRSVQSGAPWNRFRRKIGLQYTIRALEITVGPNGFHPHLHVILLASELSEHELEEARKAISQRWQSAVGRILGPQHAPDDLIGCDLRQCNQADYVSKFGLEAVGSWTKSGRAGNRTPFEVAEAWHRNGDRIDLRTWTAYCDGMRGAKMLTWSRGLREAAGLEDTTDAELVADADIGETAEVVGTIPGEVWDQVRDEAGATYRLLRAAEVHGADGVIQCLGALIRESSNRHNRGMMRYG